MGVPDRRASRAGCAPAAHATPALLARYASGVLSEGLSLAIACHLTYCPACRSRVARLEALAGAVMAEGEAVAPSEGCLPKAMARLAASPPEHAPCETAPTCGGSLPLPAPLRGGLGGTGMLCWRTVLPGVSQARLDGFASEEVSLVRARPGVQISAHTHCGEEATLILAGRMRDGERVLARGDLSLADGACHHRPEIVGGETCLCLVVLTGPLRFIGEAGRAPDRFGS